MMDAHQLSHIVLMEAIILLLLHNTSTHYIYRFII